MIEDRKRSKLSDARRRALIAFIHGAVRQLFPDIAVSAGLKVLAVCAESEDVSAMRHEGPA